IARWLSCKASWTALLKRRLVRAGSGLPIRGRHVLLVVRRLAVALAPRDRRADSLARLLDLAADFMPHLTERLPRLLQLLLVDGLWRVPAPLGDQLINLQAGLLLLLANVHEQAEICWARRVVRGVQILLCQYFLVREGRGQHVFVRQSHPASPLRL